MYSGTSEALTALLPNVPVFWVPTPHRFVNNYGIFEETRRSIREEEGITFFSLFTPSEFSLFFPRRVQLKRDGTRWRTGGEVMGKLANGMGSQYLHTTSKHGVSSITTITTADAHTSATSSRLNWRPYRFK
jgi:hypothetical protein